MRMYIREQFLRSHEMAQKRPKYAGPIFSTQMYVREQFLRLHEMAQQRPKYAGPIYFHADICQRTIFEIAQNGTKKGPNTPARYNFTRMYIERNFCGSFYEFCCLACEAAFGFGCLARSAPEKIF